MTSAASKRAGIALALLGVFGFAPMARAQMGQPGMGGPPPGGGKRAPSEDILPEVDPKLADDAQAVFDHAEADFAKEEWLSAIAYYQHVRTKFAYNAALATRAELRLGDIAYRREHWSEARGYYRSFIRFHPTHPQADYASFRAALCTWRDVPGDGFFSPPAAEKDQSDVRGALQQMRDFSSRYPTSSYVPEARAVISEAEDKLAAHELYVARFYMKRGKWKGTVLRAQGLAGQYPASAHTHEALALAVGAQMKLGDATGARRTLEQLEQLSPSAPVLARAKAAVDEAPATSSGAAPDPAPR
jgi:outer membrane protein assembly factor BamD